MFVSADQIDVVLRAVLLSAIAVMWVVLVVRIIGLRAFSKMTAFDFVITVAIGSVLSGASQATSWSGFLQALLALASLLFVQFGLAYVRRRSDRFADALQNAPVLLMRDGAFFEDALDAARITRGDVIAKLREANVLRLSDVRAVVLETTGDISVLHGNDLSDALLEGVRDVDCGAR